MNANPKFNIEAAIESAEGGNTAMWEQVARHLLKQPPANDDLYEQGDSPELRATYPARCEEWRARQERARKATLAYEAHRNRNGNFTPPKNKEPRATYKKAYYEGGFRMVIDGVPIRMAAHVKKWKKSNRDALCQGFDAFGLELERPAKHRSSYWGHWVPSYARAPKDAYWRNHRSIRPLESILDADTCRELINSGDYRKWRPSGVWSLFQERTVAEYQRESDRWIRSPNLFQWARAARRLANAA